jgi:hypothetical protein
VGYAQYKINQENIEKARELFNYAKFLIVEYEEWDKKKLPNPEYYPVNLDTYIWQVNSLYSYAVVSFMCHEFTHLKYHAHQYDKKLKDEDKIAFEKEADSNAIEILKKGLMEGYSELADAQRLVVEDGIVLGIICMFYLTDKTSSKTHPALQYRLTNALESLPLENNENVWDMACLGLQLWDEQFNKKFVWNNKATSKEQYYDIIKQINAG